MDRLLEVGDCCSSMHRDWGLAAPKGDRSLNQYSKPWPLYSLEIVV